MKDIFEKYTILIDLLKHQDKQINSFLTWNVIIQGVLLTLIELDIVEQSQILLYALQSLGVVFAVFWILSGIRLKSYTKYYIDRLKLLENSPEFNNDFMLFLDGETKTKKGVSKSLYLVWIPSLLILIWLLIFISSIVN